MCGSRHAEYLGSLAINKKSGDDIRRLGFDVNGLISNPRDLDVYSFEADAGTEVWVDFDHTTHALDAIVELVDGTGSVLARSTNSLDESSGKIALFQDSSVPAAVHPMAKVDGMDGVDYWQTNQRDPGLRIATLHILFFGFNCGRALNSMSSWSEWPGSHHTNKGNTFRRRLRREGLADVFQHLAQTHPHCPAPNSDIYKGCP